MRAPLLLLLLLLLPWMLLACDRAGSPGGAGGGALRAALPGAPSSAPAPTEGRAAEGQALPRDTTFAALVAALSEPGGYFDTDNLISNESSYLHVVGALESVVAPGGAYLGVGPDQNFSYIAAVRPSIAFVVDIRRDNLLQHLWFRALFEASATRLDYLCLMVVRRCGGDSAGLEVDALVARVDAAPVRVDRAAAIEAVVRRAAAFGVPLDSADLAAIRSIHARFADAGLDLRFSTHGRAPRPYYPTLRRLIVERDRAGRRSGYLAADSSFEVVRSLEAAGMVVPVVGDLAGPHAIRAIGELLRGRGLTVGAYYVSNVEYYLFDDGAFPAFIANLGALPAGEGSVLVRSVFRSPVPVPERVPGYASAQVVEAIPALLRDWEQGRIRYYGDLVARVRD